MPNQKRITLGELFDRLIKPKHNVVCMGSYTGPYNDPSLLKAALITFRGKGSTTIVDSQADGLYNRLVHRREMKKRLGKMHRQLLNRLERLPHAGAGDPLEYLRAIRVFRSRERK